jgi:hypothetical protein
MYIEGAGLSDKHSEVKFVNYSRYELQDKDSLDGTWVRVVDELDIESEPNNREYQIFNTPFQLIKSDGAYFIDINGKRTEVSAF